LTFIGKYNYAIYMEHNMFKCSLFSIFNLAQLDIPNKTTALIHFELVDSVSTVKLEMAVS